MNWNDAIALYVRTQRLAGYPSTTIATRRQHLEHLGRRIGAAPWEVDGEELALWADDQVWSNETKRGRRSTYRSFYAWGLKKGHTTVNPALELPRVKPGEADPRPAPDRVYHEALMKANARDRMIMRLAAEMGLRRAEVAQVHSDDLFEDLFGWSLRVHGKGGKPRTVPCTRGIALDLLDLPRGYAFPGKDNGHLSARWVGKIVTKLMPGRWTMHTLRHRFATLAYSVDRDVFTVQKLLGHASSATTGRYVAIYDDSLRKTVDGANALARVTPILGARAAAASRAIDEIAENDYHAL